MTWSGLQRLGHNLYAYKSAGRATDRQWQARAMITQSTLSKQGNHCPACRQGYKVGMVLLWTMGRRRQQSAAWQAHRGALRF